MRLELREIWHLRTLRGDVDLDGNAGFLMMVTASRAHRLH